MMTFAPARYSSYAITILTNDDRWKGLGPTVKRGVEAALADYLSSLRKQGSTLKGDSRLRGNDKIFVTVLLTNDAEVKALNAQYRGKNKPTNVLSFPDGSEEMGARGKMMVNLGDIAMAYETIAREAEQQGKALKHHISHLAVHGTLHLLGFDHENDTEARAMEKLEIVILARMGIANPYESE